MITSIMFGTRIIMASKGGSGTATFEGMLNTGKITDFILEPLDITKCSLRISFEFKDKHLQRPATASECCIPPSLAYRVFEGVDVIYKTRDDRLLGETATADTLSGELAHQYGSNIDATNELHSELFTPVRVPGGNGYTDYEFAQRAQRCFGAQASCDGTVNKFVPLTRMFPGLVTQLRECVWMILRIKWADSSALMRESPSGIVENHACVVGASIIVNGGEPQAQPARCDDNQQKKQKRPLE